jgi:hypothetical protein
MPFPSREATYPIGAEGSRQVALASLNEPSGLWPEG